MLDRGFGPYIPYFFNEKPELIKQYDGFTYYSNTISFGGHTNFASSAFFGGYEYTPTEINSRKTKSLLPNIMKHLKLCLPYSAVRAIMLHFATATMPTTSGFPI